MKIKSSTRSELAKAYNVNYVTFKKWLLDIPELNIDTKKRILTPKQVAIILEHLGDIEY